MNKKFDTHKLVLTALLVALQIVFVRLLPIEAGSIRISLGFLPVAAAGMAAGIRGGAAAAVIADILGMLLFSRGNIYFPLFTLTELLYGVSYGVILKKDGLSSLKISAFVVLQFILLNLIVNSFFLYLYYILVVGTPQGFFVIFTGRLLAAAVNLPLQLAGINLVYRYLKKPLKRLSGR